MSTLDEKEYAELQRTVESVEKALATPTGATMPNALLADFLHNARKRLETLEQEGRVFAERENKEKAAHMNAVIAHLVHQETALTAREQEAYAGFLQKDWFTKADFAQLENFYATAWDRLSDEGKDQMSRRLWEGIRRGEYTFADLPEIVKQKEAEQLRELLGANDLSSALAQIPETERQAFVRAYDAGDMETAYELMGSERFTENVGRDTSTHVAESAVAAAKEGDAKKVLEEKREDPKRDLPTRDALADIDLADVDLKALDQVEETAQEQHAKLSTTGQGRSR